MLARVLAGRLIRQGRLRQLQLLVMVADCGCIARAAKEACMSQSAATQALAQLELLLGIKLFERHARGIRPTEGGRGFISHVREVMARLQESAEFLAASRQGNTMVLRIGSIPAASYALTAPVLSTFHQAHPEVRIELHEDRGVRLIPLLGAGCLDVVFCRMPPLLPKALARCMLRNRFPISCNGFWRLPGGKRLLADSLCRRCHMDAVSASEFPK